jgi:hypothetical protein
MNNDIDVATDQQVKVQTDLMFHAYSKQINQNH